MFVDALLGLQKYGNESAAIAQRAAAIARCRIDLRVGLTLLSMQAYRYDTRYDANDCIALADRG